MTVEQMRHGKREAVRVFVSDRRVDGLILMPSGKSGKHLERFLHVGKPVVLIDRNLEDVPCDSVLVDNRGAAQAAVERLFSGRSSKDRNDCRTGACIYSKRAISWI